MRNGDLQPFSTSNPELQKDGGMEQIVYSKLGAAMYHPVLFKRRPEPACGGQLGDYHRDKLLDSSVEKFPDWLK